MHSCENPDFRDCRARHEWEGDNGDEDHVNRFEEKSIPFKEDHKLSIWKPSTKHLDGKDWEVYVLDLGGTGENSINSRIYGNLLDWAYCGSTYGKNSCKVSLESLMFWPFINYGAVFGFNAFGGVQLGCFAKMV